MAHPRKTTFEQAIKSYVRERIRKQIREDPEKKKAFDANPSDFGKQIEEMAELLASLAEPILLEIAQHYTQPAAGNAPHFHKLL